MSIIDAEFIKEPIPNKQRLAATFKTAVSNRDVLVDVDLLAGESLIYILAPQFAVPTVFLQAFTLMARPLIARFSNDEKRLETRIDDTRRKLREERLFVGILKDAWKTGEVQKKENRLTVPSNARFG